MKKINYKRILKEYVIKPEESEGVFVGPVELTEEDRKNIFVLSEEEQKENLL